MSLDGDDSRAELEILRERGQVGGDAVCEPLHLHYNELSRNPVCTLTKNIPSECGQGANDQG